MSEVVRRLIMIVCLVVAACAPALSAAVSISTVSPLQPSYPLCGNAYVTVTGTGFEAGATVLIVSNSGNVVADAVWVSSSTSLSCVTPASLTAAGQVGLQVVNPDGSSAIIAITGVTPNPAFVNPAPTIATTGGIAPDAGGFAGGQAITISGTGFSIAQVTVMVAGQQALSGAPVSTLSIACSTPALAGYASAQTVPVVVINNDGQCAAGSYVYQPGPLISGVTPDASVLAGLTPVVITGANFVPGAGGTTVQINGLAVTALAVSPGTISCTAPQLLTTPVATQSVSLLVTNPDGQTATLGFVYTSDPFLTITSLSPSVGPLGVATPITIAGTGFDANTTVSIGGSPASSTLVLSTQITTSSSGAVMVPGTVTVQLTAQDGQIALASFSYQGTPPAISSITPAYAPASGGTEMTITGSNFIGSTVTVGGAAATAVTLVSSSEIVCLTPAGTPGPATVTVTNGDGTTASSTAGAFTYQNTGAQPTITALLPNFGLVGTPVEIVGTNFQPASQVFFGTLPASDVVFVSSTLITCVVPPAASGTETVSVVNSDSLSAIAVDGFWVKPVGENYDPRCGHGHGIFTLLMLPLTALRLFQLRRLRSSRPAGSTASER